MIGTHITVVPKGNGAPRRGGQFVKPHVDLAPMQVQIGFDLSPKGGEALDSSHHTDSHRRADQTTADGSINLNACFLHKPPLASPSPAIPYKSAATSPRSVLQQLLRPALPQSHPVPSGVSSPQSAGSSFFSHIVQSVKASTESPANVISSGPQCKQSSFDADSARKHLDNKLPNLSTNENEPLLPSSHFNQTKGIAVLVSGSPFSAINKCEEVSDGLFPSVAVRATKLVGRTLGKSGGIGATIPGGGFELINASRSSAEKRIAINEGCDVAENVPVCSDKDHETNRHKGDARSNKKGNATTISVGIKAWKKGNSAEKSKKTSLFTFGETPPSPAYRRIYDHGDMIVDMDFLNSCFLCKRHLGQGEETFMYSGDKAFCSPECRYQQILMDEQKEGRIPRIIRAGTSPVHRDFICSAIVATAVATPSATAHSPITMNRSNFIRPTAAA